MMRFSSKFTASGWLFVFVLSPLALASGSPEPQTAVARALATADTALACTMPSVAEARPAGTQMKPVDFCLPGEKLVCTLGPPPVCHCEAK